MPQNENASPICRGKNLSWETVLLFYNNMPREPMPISKFHSITESRINGWTQTHSQIARQLAFYYEENGICFPRFTDKTSYTELFAYMQNWASKYFVPNPYTDSLKKYQPTCIYTAIVESVKSGISNFDNILDSIWGVELNNKDKVKVFLSNFTDLIIKDKQVSINERSLGFNTELHPEIDLAFNTKKYFEYYSVHSDNNPDKRKNKDNMKSLQAIFYGAPGTGKSQTIKSMVDDMGKKQFRTTFHPDSDYSTFVGAYKPKMENNKIVYSYEPQAFTNAYIEAWKSKEDVYLIIEEINRGNCAQIFGDLFQLLDRKNGESEYPIKTDSALAEYLKVKFEGMDLPESIRNGVELKLPNNLYIWATMNTSDQSLFPIDSAFKRRWDWKYVKIAKGRDKKTKQPLSWIVDFNFEDGDKKYHCSFDWWEFILRINEIIASATSSDDKKLGYFFCKPKNEDGTEIDAETFVGKVVFYLWNDVLKEEKPELFKVHLTKGEPSFDAFYNEDKDGETVVDTLALKDFVSNVFGDDFKEKVAINEITNKEIAENENLTLTPE